MINKVFSIISLSVILLSADLLKAQTVMVNDHSTPAVDTSSYLIQPSFEEMPVYRLQLRFTTGKTNDAGTDDPVYVQMNNENEKFFLVQGIDNFQQGKTVIYDVLINGIKKVKDIDFLRFGINGGDGVCLKKIELLLNNYTYPIFTKEYQGEKGSCIDNASSTMAPTLRITGSELRASTKWNYAGARKNMWRPPTVITSTWMQSMIEAVIGNQIYQEGGSVKWGTTGNRLENQTLWGQAVEIKRINDNTFHIDLDLEADVNGPNPEIDVNFDLEISCKKGTIEAIVKNANLQTDITGTVLKNAVPIISRFLGAGIGFFAGSFSGNPITAVKGAAAGMYAAGKLSYALFNFKFPHINNPNLSQGCKLIKIERYGNITLQ